MSQALIDGAGNFGYFDELFGAQRRRILKSMIDSFNEDRLRADTDPSAPSMMINVEEPIEYSQPLQTSKSQLAGINEPRDALLTIWYGLLTTQIN